jgi:hypothetical protein
MMNDDDDILKFNVIQAVKKTTAKTHAWPEGRRCQILGAYLLYMGVGNSCRCKESHLDEMIFRWRGMNPPRRCKERNSKNQAEDVTNVSPLISSVSHPLSDKITNGYTITPEPISSRLPI